MMRTRLLCLLAALVVTAACGSSSSPTGPSGGGSTGGGSTGGGSAANAPPTLDAPSAEEQLNTLRPTLRVKNGTSATTGTRTYEFQVSDHSDFSQSGGNLSAYYSVAQNRTGIAEGSSTTSVDIEQDLLPATRFYWRARWVQGSSTGEWSSTFSFRTQIVGYNRPGELYDPLVNGATVGEMFVNADFVAGKGIRLRDTNGWVRYRLAQPVSNGEFSLDVEGISDNPVSPSRANLSKLKILSMDDNTSNHYTSDYLLNAQYRGFDGNPNHAISFKVLMGEDTDSRKLEPDLGERTASVRRLNASNTYYWRVMFGNFIQLVVQDGGPGGVSGSGSGAGGSTIYDMRKNSSFTYMPNPHYAYIGVNNNIEDTGSWPATYRNVWIGSKPRPASLGNALAPR